MKIIGIDLGTTNIKGIVVNKSGEIIEEYSQKISVIEKQNGIREQNIEEIIEKLLKILKFLTKKHVINAFSLSSAMHSMILIDKEYKPLTNSIIWSDTRSKNEIKELEKHINKNSFHEKTGVPLHPMTWLGKILWFQKQNKEKWEKTIKIISLKEYICNKLYGELVVDYSIAASSGLLNLKSLKWEPEILKLLKINDNFLSKIKKPTYVLEGLKEEYITLFKKKIPMVLGSSDGCLANIGSGIINDKKIAISIGTSSAVRTTMDKSWIDKKHKLFCYPIFEKLFVIGGASNNAGNVLDWYINKIREKISYEKLWSEFQKSTAGSNGLIFLPYINGERAPYWNASAKGSWLNLDSIHNRYDMTRSVLEGVSLAITSIIWVLKESENGNKEKEIILSGGVLKSESWIQLLSDVSNMKINITNTSETAAIGAAFIGFMAFDSKMKIQDIKRWIKVEKKFKPNIKNSKIYSSLLIDFINSYYKIFEKLNYINRKEKDEN